MKLGFDAGKGNVPLKQGYLHIKRERNSDRLSSRALSKPWQRAYFILFGEPIFFEEYKDASLKQRKHIHILTFIKHVGPIKTSRSKQHAFEIIDEKTSLLLACENQSLLEEWIKAFIEVMQKRKMQSMINLNESPNDIRQECYPVDIVETTLSGMNNLHGEYLAVISNTRMYLRDPEEGDILSWPLTHIAGHRCEPSQNRVVLVLGKNCHFGNGKLILATKEYAQIISILNNLVGERRRIHKTVSSPECSPIHHIGKHSLPSDTSNIFTEEGEGRQKTSYYVPEKAGNIRIEDSKTNLQRIKSCPNIQDVSPNLPCPSTNINSPLRSIQESCPNLNDSTGNVSNNKNKAPKRELTLQKTKLKRVHGRKEPTFPETSTDEGYIPPDNLHLPQDEEKTNRLLLVTTPERTSPLDRPPSINENDNSSSPYLHILDDDGNNDHVKRLSDSNLSSSCDEQLELLRNSITEELANPQKPKERKLSPIGIETCFDEHRRPSSPLPSPKVKTEQWRRPSEPIKKSVFEPFRNRHKHSCTEIPSSDTRKSSSPRLSPKQTSISLPKQKSMKQGNVFEKTATTCLIQHKIPKRDIPGLLPTSNSIPPHRSRPNSRDLDSVSVSVALDEPPPLPFRESPELLQRAQHDLTITIREETNKGRRNTMSDIDDRNHTITVNSHRTFISAPPIPPKSKPLALTKSGAVCESKDEYNGDASRRSSCGEDPWISADDTNDNDKDPGTPPAVPKRNYNRNLIKQQKIVPPETGSFGLNENTAKKHKRPSPLASKPPMSKSLDSLSFTPPAHLTFPEEEEKAESSPPPHRRISPSHSPSKHSILLDGEGKDFPSISVTKLAETNVDEV